MAVGMKDQGPGIGDQGSGSESGSGIRDERVARWLAALEARHLADLRVPEVTRALRALSSAYVERRTSGRDATARRVGDTLDTAGKRAAFALFYGPLHFIAITAIIDALGAELGGAKSIIDLGCGTGVGGAAWALAAGGSPAVTGIDRHPWAVAEARWTYAQLGLRGRTTQGDAARLPRLDPGDGVIAAYTLNELPDALRERVVDDLLAAAARGVRVLVVEPISRRVTPWWDQTVARAARVSAGGVRADEWKFAADLPPLVERFDRAAGLNHQAIACRSFCLSAQRLSAQR